MKLKKLIILSLLMSCHLATRLVAQDLPVAQPIQNEQENYNNEINNEERAEIVAICMDMQKETFKQMDYLTAILQQILGCIQKGSVKATAGNTGLAVHILAYMELLQSLQGTTLAPADPEMILHTAVILKNIIARLTVAVDANFENFGAPIIEELIIPDKNSEISFQYIHKLQEKNDKNLDILEEKCTSIGLTKINKAVRSMENFYKRYKYFLWTPAGIAALYGASQIWKAPFVHDGNNNTFGGAFTKNLGQIFSMQYLLPTAGSICLLAGKQNIEKFGTYLIDKSIDSVRKNYKKLKMDIINTYNILKGIKNVKKNGMALSLENEITLDDPSLIGLEDQIHELYKIIDLFENAERNIHSDIEIPKGWLLTGPSRTGKTALVKALGATINKLYESKGLKTKIELIPVDYTMITNGVTLKSYIDYALSCAPAILFIDEIHLLGIQNVGGDRALLFDFLTQLNELHKIKDPNKQVIIIGATNQAEKLAKELFTYQRFGKRLEFKTPGPVERAAFFAERFQKYGINIKNIDMQSIILQTRHCHFGHLHQIVKEARFEAHKNGQGINQMHLQHAINDIVHGITSASGLMQDEARSIALDQAGKIVAHHMLEISEIITIATICKVRRTIEEENFWLAGGKDDEKNPIRYGTVISSSLREAVTQSDAGELEKLCKRNLAGIATQKLMLGSYSIDYCAPDYRTAFEIAQKILLKGQKLKELPTAAQSKLFEQAQALVDRYEQEITDLLKNHSDLIKKIAEELLKRPFITGADIKKLIE